MRAYVDDLQMHARTEYREESYGRYRSRGPRALHATSEACVKV